MLRRPDSPTDGGEPKERQIMYVTALETPRDTWAWLCSLPGQKRRVRGDLAFDGLGQEASLNLEALQVG